MKRNITAKHLLTCLFILLLAPAYAQVGVGTLTPHSSAKLEVVSDTSGVLLTRMTHTQMTAISNPANGLLVYCTDDAGFFVYQNSQWQKVGIQNLALSGDSLKIDKEGLGVDLSPFLDNTDSQSLSKTGDTIRLANGGYVLDRILTEAEVDTYVSNNGYLTTFSEVDGSITNEIQNLTLSGDSLKIDKGGTGVNLVSLKDNLGNHTATTNLNLGANKLVGNGGTSGISIASDGRVSLASGDSINEFSTDTTLADNSNLAVPTEKAVKTYVDNTPKLIQETGLGNYHFGLNNMGSIQSGAARNIALGENSLNAITTGDFNIGLGYNTIPSLTNGYGNIAIGTQALKSGTTGFDNIGIGRDAGEAVTTGHRNVLVGKEAGHSLTTEVFNTFIGNRAGYDAQTSSSVFIGSFAGWGETTNQMLYIENSDDSIPLIGGSFNNQIVGINMLASELQSGATLQVGGDIALENGSAINEFSTDASLAGNSHLAVPTEQAVKTYVDNVPKLIQEPGLGNYHFDLNNMDSLISGQGNYNLALGQNGLNNVTSGDNNVSLGSLTNQFLTTGGGNIAINTHALKNNVSGNGNIGIGRGAGVYTTGSFNVLIGDQTGHNTTGHRNTFIGANAGVDAQTNLSVFLGHFAGYYEDTDQMLYIENSADSVPLIGGSFINQIVGINMPADSLLSGATLQVGGDIALENGSAINEFSTDATLAGNSDLAVPTEAAVKSFVEGKGYLTSITEVDGSVTNEIQNLTLSGDSLKIDKAGTGVDLSSLSKLAAAEGINNYHSNLNNMDSINSGAVLNLALGPQSLQDLITGNYNIGVGYATNQDLNSGSGNIAIGTQALIKNTTGSYNVGIGRDAGANITGGGNVLIGDGAGEQTTGANNTFIGARVGKNAQTNYSVYLGQEAGWNLDIDSMLVIENTSSVTPLIAGSFSKNIVGVNMPDSTLLSGATFQVGGTASKSVAGSWTANSDKRLKTNINYMQSEEMLQKMLALKGVTYEWNDTVTGIPRPEGIQYGFIAQDLEKVWPSKISKDGQGYLLTSYGDYDPMFVESIKALYQRIAELETEKQQLHEALRYAEEERASIRDEMRNTKSESEELRNEMDDIKKRLLSLSVQ